jgi:hypothetical protein
MTNLLQKLGAKGLLIVAVIIHWLLDDLVVFLPDSAVWAISGTLFKMTGNGYRLDPFKAFWTARPAA